MVTNLGSQGLTSEGWVMTPCSLNSARRGEKEGGSEWESSWEFDVRLWVIIPKARSLVCSVATCASLIEGGRNQVFEEFGSWWEEILLRGVLLVVKGDFDNRNCDLNEKSWDCDERRWLTRRGEISQCMVEVLLKVVKVVDKNCDF